MSDVETDWSLGSDVGWIDVPGLTSVQLDPRIVVGTNSCLVSVVGVCWSLGSVVGVGWNPYPSSVWVVSGFLVRGDRVSVIVDRQGVGVRPD